MNRFVLLASLILVAMPSLALGDDSKPAIDGSWLATSAELRGKELPAKAAATIKLTLNNGKYEVIAESADRGTVTYDNAAKPKTMEIKGTEGPNKGKTILAIYELKDDTLTICYDLSGTARPTEFKTQPNSKLFLVTYKREKP